VHIQTLLTNKEAEVLKKWFYTLVKQLYPQQTAKFFSSEKDPFANPVGTKIYDGLQSIYSHLLGNKADDKMYASLEDIIRVMVVQSTAPSQGLSFMFSLKDIIRNELIGELGNEVLGSEELAQLERQIDGMLLVAADVYHDCREKIYANRVEEVKRNNFRLLQRANLID